MNKLLPLRPTLVISAIVGAAIALQQAALPLKPVVILIGAALGLVSGWLLWAVCPISQTRKADNALEARRKQRRDAFWKRKKRKVFWITLLTFLVLSLIVGIVEVLDRGLARLEPLWLFALIMIGYSTLMAWGTSEVGIDQIRKSRQRPVNSRLPLPAEPSFTTHVANTLKQERRYWIFTWCLLLCTGIWRLAGPGPLANFMVVPTAIGTIVWLFWSILVKASRMTKLPEVRRPSDKVLALAADPATRVRAIKLYRRKANLGVKTARAVIEGHLL